MVRTVHMNSSRVILVKGSANRVNSAYVNIIVPMRSYGILVHKTKYNGSKYKRIGLCIQSETAMK